VQATGNEVRQAGLQVELHEARQGIGVKEKRGHQRIREEKPAQQQQRAAKGIGRENYHRKQPNYHKQTQRQVAQRPQPNQEPGPKQAAVVVALAGSGQQCAQRKYDEGVPQQQR
jgi:hypothetical protein